MCCDDVGKGLSNCMSDTPVTIPTTATTVLPRSSHRPEHIFMAVVLVMVTVQWALCTRLYTQDVFQERNLVYFGGV